jgi:hypothetical protein
MVYFADITLGPRQSSHVARRSGKCASRPKFINGLVAGRGDRDVRAAKGLKAGTVESEGRHIEPVIEKSSSAAACQRNADILELVHHVVGRVGGIELHLEHADDVLA